MSCRYTVPKSIGSLLKAVRLAKSNPYMRFKVPGDWDMTAKEVLRMWTDGVHARASRGLPQLSAKQLKRHLDLQIDARWINEYARGVRCTGCRGLLRDSRMKRKYPHIDNQPAEHWY